ncbi:MAG: hypothetical protein A2X05_15435 [Bacteroidetes bacterium GWE2_41_25]|nr:MAG: hypothetical protein A2X05_15435 [Bacteroidetes bacterium GWE2_41_25]
MEKGKSKRLSPLHLKIFSVTGIIFILIPVSIFALWIYSANTETTQADSVEISNSYFPDFLQGRFDTIILSPTISDIAIILAIIGLKLPGKIRQNINLVILKVGSLLIFLNPFSMM